MGPDPTGLLDRLVDGQVRGVGSIAQEIKDQGREAFEGGPGLRWDSRDVGAPGQGKGVGLIGSGSSILPGELDPETKDRQPAMERPLSAPAHAYTMRHNPGCAVPRRARPVRWGHEKQSDR